MFKYYVSKFSLILEPPPPTLRSCHLVLNSFISLGDHEISHGEISPGYQENLLVNKFPVLTPPPNFCSRRSRGELIFNISSGVRLLVPIETPNLLM